ncbi:hypothetical protein L3V16_08500 [Brucella ciceri]|uniref:hypothetical protein n=1 Tax=Brucella ciceri TaxID=391287 RepID=UPI001F135BA8|nr:hypothetical protein [Brucella ciceri]MCH6203882.1 hypothetical protein [Brucella ciceri]
MRRYFTIGLGLTHKMIDGINTAIKQQGIHDHVKLHARAHPEVRGADRINLENDVFQLAIDAAYRALFGEKGRSIFCGQTSHEKCAIQFGKSKKSCLNVDPSRCRDRRPDAIICFYLSKDNFRIGGRLGRFALPIKIPSSLFRSPNEIAKFIVKSINELENSDIWTQKNENYYKKYQLLPVFNFKSSERDRLANLINSFDDYLQYSEALPDAIKKRGNKLVDDRDFEFSVDKYHRYPTSTDDKLDWLNVHYRHGFPFDNRHHYDVTDKGDKHIKNSTFYCPIEKSEKKYSGSHLNIFANGEIQLTNE